ncbi:hypothetical protein MK131_07465 [Candidatus Poribacteria bacterium]|nr:hypothetical protein [Candidatus Poribacteria bacterium]
MNSSFGTGHGCSSMMFVMVSGVKKGQVICAWRGLKFDALEGPVYLLVTTNYRKIIVSILRCHDDTGLSAVLPKFDLSSQANI